MFDLIGLNQERSFISTLIQRNDNYLYSHSTKHHVKLSKYENR